MKILKNLLCVCCLLMLIVFTAGCDLIPGGSSSAGDSSDTSSTKSGTEQLANKYAGVFYEAVPDNSNTAFSNNEKIQNVECDVYSVMQGLDEIGRVAVTQDTDKKVFVSLNGTSYTAVRQSLSELPSSEVKNINGDRMICNVEDNALYVYDVDENEAELFQIIIIDDDSDKIYTNDRISATNFNFDNYTDIAILKSDLGMVTSYSDYYLFDHKENKFIKNSALSQIPNIGVDGGEGTLSSYTRISSTDHDTVTYSWVDNELTPIKKVSQRYNDKDELFYITEYEYDEDLNEVEMNSESYTKEELEALYS